MCISKTSFINPETIKFQLINILNFKALFIFEPSYKPN